MCRKTFWNLSAVLYASRTSLWNSERHLVGVFVCFLLPFNWAIINYCSKGAFLSSRIKLLQFALVQQFLIWSTICDLDLFSREGKLVTCCSLRQKEQMAKGKNGNACRIPQLLHTTPFSLRFKILVSFFICHSPESPYTLIIKTKT